MTVGGRHFFSRFCLLFKNFSMGVRAWHTEGLITPQHSGQTFSILWAVRSSQKTESTYFEQRKFKKKKLLPSG